MFGVRADDGDHGGRLRIVCDECGRDLFRWAFSAPLAELNSEAIHHYIVKHPGTQVNDWPTELVATQLKQEG